MKRVVPVLVMGLLMLGLATTSAEAETAMTSDPRGDAARQIDITRMTVTNADRRVVVRLKVRDLRKRGAFDVHYWGGTAGAPPARSAILSTRLVRGERTARFLACDREECEQVRCRGMRLRWRPVADVVMMSAPQRCYPRPRGNSGAPAPAVGRFFAFAELADDVDSTNGSLTVRRG